MAIPSSKPSPAKPGFKPPGALSAPRPAAHPGVHSPLHKSPGFAQPGPSLRPDPRFPRRNPMTAWVQPGKQWWMYFSRPGPEAPYLLPPGRQWAYTVTFIAAVAGLWYYVDKSSERNRVRDAMRRAREEEAAK